MVPPPLKPPVRARRVRALHRGDRSALTRQAIDELFRAAEILTEGGLDGDPGERWYGSIMITFDLDNLCRRCRGLDDAEELDRVVDAIESSVRVRIRAHRMVCREVYRRFPDRPVGTAQLESAFRRDGTLLLLDVDLEVPVGVGSMHATSRGGAT
ncbi:MAG: hypothetical protein RLO52_30010 [Sandaracinaceae bacterium]|nr:MAG: hypothetical protein EVA89_34210 [Sandaracinaceae bacterium]